MLIASFRNHPDKLNDKEYCDLRDLFLRSGRCGVELEGNADPIPQEGLRCGYSIHRCGACNVDRCPDCIGCTRRSGEESCKPYNQSCLLRYALIDHPDTPIEEQNLICARCVPCDICERNCGSCRVCDNCTDPTRGDNSPASVSTIHTNIATELGITRGKSYDTGNLDDMAGDFLSVYNDGSVNTELVTKPFQFYDLERVLTRGIEVFHKYGVRMHPRERAGAHQTFSFASTFPDVVARNVVQLVRYYLPALLSWSTLEGTQSRGQYRKLPDNPGWGEKCTAFNNKYEACHVKSQLALEYNPKLIEFRYPDMHDRLPQHMWMVLVNAAIIMKAMKLGKQGVVSFHANHWEYVRNSTSLIYHSGEFDDGVVGLRDELLSYMDEELFNLCENSYEVSEEVKKWKLPTGDEVGKLPSINWRYREPFDRGTLPQDSIERPNIEFIPDVAVVGLDPAHTVVTGRIQGDDTIVLSVVDPPYDEFADIPRQAPHSGVPYWSRRTIGAQESIGEYHRRVTMEIAQGRRSR